MPYHHYRGTWLRSRWLGLRPRQGLRALHTPLPPSWSQDETLLEQLETGTAKVE